VPLTQTEMDVAKTVVQRFLNLRLATPRKQLLLKVGSRENLDKLQRWSILGSHDTKNYLPMAFAFHCCGDAEAEQFAKQSVTVVCHVLKNLFENEQVEEAQHTALEVEEHAQQMYGAVDAKQIWIGLYLGSQFGFSGISTGPNTFEITSLRISEQIIEIKPENVWDDYIKNQTQWIERQEKGNIKTSLQDSMSADSSNDAAGTYAGWEIVKPFGNMTGQSEVFLVRSPHRVAELAESAVTIHKYMGAIRLDQSQLFAVAVWQSARPDSPSELGALKVFKSRGDDAAAEEEALDRLKGEIQVLKWGRRGLLKLLASSEEQRWIITEYQPNGTLENQPLRFRGQASVALRAFRPLVEAVANLHKEGIVHRDIKPANVFVGNDSTLILGDFGIVYLPDQPERVTRTNERVGPYDYMPPWADLGERLEKVQPTFDVYMLGKLLWCMIAGKLKLPREYHAKPEFDLTQLFPDDPDMHIVNRILNKCVVEEARNCYSSAVDLLQVVDVCLRVIDRGGSLLDDTISRPCHVCGMGNYQMKALHPNTSSVGIRLWHGSGSNDISLFPIRVFVCDKCEHVEFFASN